MRVYTESEMINSAEDIFVQKIANRAGVVEGVHNHEFVELVYILSGRAEHFINDKRYELSKGNILFINYNQTHSYNALTELEFVNLLLKPEFMSDSLLNSKNIYEIFYLFLSDEFNNIEDIIPVVKLNGKEMVMIERVINNCIEEFNAKETGYLNILKGYMQIVFNMIIRNMHQNTESVKYIHSTLDNIISFIDKNYGQKITVEMLAERCFYNTAYFSRVFKECYGQSCSSYIKQKRLTEAIRLLKETDLSVENIIEKIGYSDKSVFYRHLKAFTGQTPSSIRKNVKK